MDYCCILGIIIYPITIQVWFQVVGVLLLLCLSGLVSASETAFFSLSPHQVSGLKSSTSRSSRAAVNLLTRADYLLSTILIANNLVNICIVILSNSVIDACIGFDDAPLVEFIIKMVIVTFLLLLFGEIMPKIFANYNSLRVIRTMSLPLSWLSRLLAPLSWLLIRTGGVINRRVAQKKVNISIDELSDAIEMTSNQTVEEKKILSGIVEFVNTEVSEIMHSRVEVVALDVEDNFDHVREVILQSGFSRIPVYEENLDNIRGVLYVKDVLPYIQAKADFAWINLCRKPYFIPEHKKINSLLEEFQTQKIHMAIVVDEYGSTLGIVSLEDILEEIVGEISDESDVEQQFYTKVAPNLYIFDGKTHLNDLLKVLGLDDDYLDSFRGDAETVAGLMLEIRRDFLRQGEVLYCRKLALTAEVVEGHRISKVRVQVGENTPLDASQNNSTKHTTL